MEHDRRTNILIGDEVLRQIDDSQHVTHHNGVMKVEVTNLPLGIKIGNVLQLGYDAIKRALQFKYLQDDWKTVATQADLANIGSGTTWDTLPGKPDMSLYALKTDITSGGGGGGVSVKTDSWMGSSTEDHRIDHGLTSPKVMLIFEYLFGIRGMWTNDYPDSLNIADNPTASGYVPIIQGAGYFSLPANEHGNKPDGAYIAAIWG